MRARAIAAALLALLPLRLSGQDSSRLAEAQSVLAPLIESYGVSSAEGPVRETVKRLLPAWAKSETDTAGNLWVRLGQGNPLVVFVAHMDEIGFRVTGVRDDGSLELPNFAAAPIGAGAVARALDNSSVTPPAYVDSLLRLARAHGVAVQVGTTNGGNDGSLFTPYGVVDVALGWPLRYSHSPAEVIDLKDVASLADLVRAIAESW